MPRVDDRPVVSGIIHVLKSGGRWSDAPVLYGPRKMLYNRFVRWAAKVVWTPAQMYSPPRLPALCLAATVSYWLCVLTL